MIILLGIPNRHVPDRPDAESFVCGLIEDSFIKEFGIMPKLLIVQEANTNKHELYLPINKYPSGSMIVETKCPYCNSDNSYITDQLLTEHFVIKCCKCDEHFAVSGCGASGRSEVSKLDFEQI